MKLIYCRNYKTMHDCVRKVEMDLIVVQTLPSSKYVNDSYSRYN